MKDFKFEKGKTYGYLFIESFINKEDYLVEELGSNKVGINFLVISHPNKDIDVSFVLVGGNDNQYQYECVYSDL